MRISDWSSDVCSSDLHAHRVGIGLGRFGIAARRFNRSADAAEQVDLVGDIGADIDGPVLAVGAGKALARRVAAVIGAGTDPALGQPIRSEEHTSELQSLMRISYAVFCLKKKKKLQQNHKSRDIYCQR